MPSRRAALTTIASAQAEAGLAEIARSNFAAATAAATAIEVADGRASALVDIASAQAEAGQIEDARSTMATVLGSEAFEAANATTLFRAAGVLFEVGRPKDAEGALHSVMSPSARRRALTFAWIGRTLGEWGWGVGEEPRRARLGVNLADGREIGRAGQGAYVQSVDSGTGAERAGLRRGDRVVRLDGVAVSNKADLDNRLRQRRPGDRIELDIVRDDQPMAVGARMGFSPPKRAVDAVAAAKEAVAWIPAVDRDGALKEIASVEAELVGRHADAIADAQRIRGASDRAEALLEIAKAQAEAGDPESARTTAELAYDAASSIEEIYLRAETLARIASAQAGAGARDRAADVVRLAAEAAATDGAPDGAYARARALAAIARAVGKVAPRAEARAAAASAAEAARIVLDADHRARVLLDIVEAQIEQGDLRRARTQMEQAASAARAIEDNAARARGLAALGSAQFEAKAGRNVGETFRVAVESAEAVEDAEQRRHSLTAVALAQAEAGRTDDARKTIAMALRAARATEHAGVSMIYIARAQAEAALMADCRSTLKQALDEVEEHIWKAQMLRLIARGQAKCGQPEDAARTMSLAIAEMRIPSELVQSLVESFPDGHEGWLAEQAWTALLSAMEAAGGCKDCVFSVLRVVDLQVEAGNVEEAARTSALVPELEPDDGFLLETSLRTQAKLGYGREALAAAESVELTGGVWSRFDLYVSVAVGAAEHGSSRDVAWTAIRRALENRDSAIAWEMSATDLAFAQAALGLDGEARATLRDALGELKSDPRPLRDLRRILRFMIENDWR